MLNKGVPSTFANLKHLYSDSFKKTALPQLVEEYLASHGEAAVTNGDSSKGKAAALYFLAQHHNYHLSRDLSKAMEYVDKAIELVPSSVDFHMTKARIWKHHGNTAKAAEIMNQARELDKKDRYINTKTAKYQLRNNENDKALKTMGLFTRAETPGGPLSDLLDMQSVWFLTEDGEAYARQGNIGMALKRFHAIFNIFDIWQEDQYDFHTFSLRKGLIRAYVDMIRWEDHLRDHPFYSRVALDAIALYVDMHDGQLGAPSTNGVNGTTADGADAGGEETAAAEKKKAAKKAKKELQKAEREAQEKAAKQDPNKAGQKGKQADAEAAKKKDEDPLGLKLAATKTPLDDAVKFLVPLLQFSPKSIEGQLAGFEVFIRRRKCPLMRWLPPPFLERATAARLTRALKQTSTCSRWAASTPRGLCSPTTPEFTSSRFGCAAPSTRPASRCRPRWPRSWRPSSRRCLPRRTWPSSMPSSGRHTPTAPRTCSRPSAPPGPLARASAPSRRRTWRRFSTWRP